MLGRVLLLWLVLAVPVKAAAIEDMTRPWPGAVVPYKIDPAILKRAGAKGTDCRNWRDWSAATQGYKVCRAMSEWQTETGVRFVAYSKGPKWLDIRTSDSRTNATLGYTVINWVNVQSRSSYGAVLHEFGHVLGLTHEHMRPDRDDYIVLAPFIADSLKGCNPASAMCRDVLLNFPRHGRLQMKTDYDPCSLMHYLSHQGPRYPDDPRWRQAFTLTRAGADRMDVCSGQFQQREARCRKVGQKCAITEDDAGLVRRFHGLALH
ncbi:hypothetical protein GCM10011273_32440 [Asticcacaulis endophyticus]|uniref:Peptidase metallopeptidase domain-containing protein n=1 Tax=Asticcacaulis endophyticus TaxID=1395890 RepID=A0A918UXM0_9CAUL|nr:hypothetical protein GCM10011273_32440 [Asticcacaulis endophyticus]